MPLIFAMYGGESETIPFRFETDDCTVIGNETGVNFTFSDNEVLVESEINYVGNFTITCYDWLTKEEETYSSGGSSPAPKDWSARCGYNLECLYGKTNQSNETIETNQTIEITEPVTQEGITTGMKVMIGIFVVVGLGLIILLLKKIFKPKEKFDLDFEGADKLKLENGRTE